MLCPACGKQREKAQWSQKQWRQSDPRQLGRNCCKRCEDMPKTWFTNKVRRIAQRDFASSQGCGDGDGHRPRSRSRSRGAQRGRDGHRPPSRAQRSRSRSRSRGATAAERRSGGISSDMGTPPSVVGVPVLSDPQMERRSARGHMECPCPIDTYTHFAAFEQKAEALIEDWRKKAFRQQSMRPDFDGKGNSRIAWAPGKAHFNSRLPDSVYKMDFDNPTYDIEKATVTIPVSRTDFLLIASA